MNLDDDDFTLFGLSERFALDPDLLERRRRELQAEVHPDRFAGQGAAAQRVAMQWAVRVNEAWRRLRDPLERAAYLCARRGEPVLRVGSAAMPAAFLGQQMAWREALDEAHDAAAVRTLAAQVGRHEEDLLRRLGTLLDEHGDVVAAAEQVRALMFVARFRQDLEHRLEQFEH